VLEIRYYLAPDGRSPFEGWFSSLDPAARAKVTVGIARLEQGNLSNVQGVGEGVLEYRINFGPGYRVYFGRAGDPADGRHQEAAAAGHINGDRAVGGLPAPPAPALKEGRWH
jgi:putative addiction module killer protein